MNRDKPKAAVANAEPGISNVSDLKPVIEENVNKLFVKAKAFMKGGKFKNCQKTAAKVFQAISKGGR